MYLVPLIVLLAYVSQTSGHSWIACADYTEKNGRNWDPQKCRGFPRDSENFAQKGSFGSDRGFDHRPAQAPTACKTPLSGSSYSRNYPKAVYYPGQQVVIVHPMKTHGICGRRGFTPDNGNAIYHGRKGTDTNEPLSHYKQFLVSDLGRSVNIGDHTKYPKPGYMNAPAFCENRDRSMGTYSFNIPDDFEQGEYTFVWEWEFNRGELYSTCFDVKIARNKLERDIILMNNGLNDLSVPCGGVLSNLKAGSTVGCNEPNPGTPAPPTSPSTMRPTSGDNAVVNVHFVVNGEIDFNQLSKNENRRLTRVSFKCKSEARFWNAKVVNGNNSSKNHYVVLQESSEIKSGKIFFSAFLLEDCNAKSDFATVVIM